MTLRNIKNPPRQVSTAGRVREAVKDNGILLVATIYFLLGYFLGGL